MSKGMRQWCLMESFVWRHTAAGWFLCGPFKASLAKDWRGVSVSMEEGWRRMSHFVFIHPD